MALKIIFMGTPDFAVPILKKINDSEHKILEVYTQPPKKKNRGQKINTTPVHDFSVKNGLKVRSPTNLNTSKEFNELKKSNPDVVLVVAYGKIIPSNFLDIKKINFINIHASLLPKWRGAAPIQRAIMNLDSETGISIMKIMPKIDSGPIMLKAKVALKKNTNYEDLSRILSELGAEKIVQALDLIEKKKAIFLEQDEKEATYAKKIDKYESKIVWTNNAKNIIAKINAFYPSPGLWFNYKGSRIKILKAKEVDAKGEPGEIIDNNLTIACLDKAIQILELQKEGKKKMLISDYLMGSDFEIGAYAK